MKTYFIYILKSSKCSKAYVGVSTNPERRFKQHLNVAKHKWRTLTKCGRAVKRYGASTFTMRIVAECKTSIEASKEEDKWIKRFGKKRLWNTTSGGYGDRK